MAYQSLYRRYRPRRFSEIRGQSHVVTALRNAVRNNSVGHAYLFSGPRGTGKTSTARILAKALNCENPIDGEPCCECESCVDMEAGRSFDLFELDAASNNGVDAIRDLVDRAAVGSPGRTKVYILDEVHMLSTAASNALLKTLEEPPGHVRFVLATTDPQKVLPTIKSRTQHYEFQLLGASELEEYVRWIIADADLSVDDEAARWAVRQGKGSARDTLSALDQVVAAGGVVERVEPVDALLVALADGDPGAAIRAVADALNLGHDPRVLGRALVDSLRDLFLLSLDAPVPHLVPEDVERLSDWAARLGTPMLTRSIDQVGSALVEMRNAADPRIPLEVALIKLTRADVDSLDGLIARIEKLEAALAHGGGAAGPATNGRSTGSGRPRAGSGDSTAGDRAAAHDSNRGPGTASNTPPYEPPVLPDAPVPPVAPATPRHAAPPDGPVPPGSTDTPPEPPAVRPGMPAAPVPPALSPHAPDDPVMATSTGRMTAGSTPVAERSEDVPSGTPESAPTGPVGQSDGSSVSIESLNAVLAEKVLPVMKGVAKAIYAQGRFIAFDGQIGTYLVENAPTRDRAEKSRSRVEELLSQHLNATVSVRVVDTVDDPPASPRSVRAPESERQPPSGERSLDQAQSRRTPSDQMASTRSERAPNDHGGPGSHRPPGTLRSTAVTAGPDAAGSTGPTTGDGGGSSGPMPGHAPVTDDDEFDDEMAMDVRELEDATDVATTGLERLLEAFPGAEVIEQDAEVR